MGGIPLEEKEAKVRENLCMNILLSYHNYLNFLVPHLSNIFNAAEFVNSIMHKGSRHKVSFIGQNPLKNVEVVT